MKVLQRRTRIAGVTIALAGLLLGSAACDSENPKPAAQETTVVTTQPAESPHNPAPQPAPAASTDSPAGRGQAEAPVAPNPDAPRAPAKPGTNPGNCGTERGAAEIIDHIGQLPPNQFGWKATEQTNYNRCSDLSFALIEQAQQGNAQFQTQLMLFHQGKFIGVGSDTVQQVTQVLRFDDASVTVRMKDWEALEASGDANANAQKYYSDVTFRWVGDHVEPQGRIPNQKLPKS